MAAPLPVDEDVRLAALRDFHILDTKPEDAYDDIVRLAAFICGTPIATISLIDVEREWFKSAVGLPLGEVPRDLTFCAHTILQPDLMVVPDATKDRRFADNPFVTGDPNIRFYAGIPLITEGGHALGSLCVIDRIPRTLNPEQVAALRTLAHQVVGQMERTRWIAERERSLADAEARAEREALLSRIGQALLATTDPAVIQERAAALLGEALGADRCYLSIWDTARDRILVLQDYRRGDLPSVAGEYRASQFAPVMDALFAHGTAVVPNVRPSGLPGNVVEMMEGFALNSVLAVPFFDSEGRITAALMVAMTDGPRPWTPEEVSLAETVAALTRTAVDAAHLHQREHRIAEQLQATLQPALPAQVPGLELAAYYRPALEDQGVGGDFSDVFMAEKGVTFLVVGDLSGKGLVAASSVAMVRNMLRFALYNGHTLAEPVTALNATLADNDLLDGFTTLFVGRYDPQSRTLTYVNCGQDAGLILRAASGIVEPLPPTGLVLGTIRGATYTEETVHLETGDMLALYTDGLTEAGPSRTAMLTGDGVADLLRGLQGVTDPQTVVARLMAGVDTFAGLGVRDDQCLLVGVVTGG
jgi:serine phosphatase RsbU (regulator of sigma subunit)